MTAAIYDISEYRAKFQARQEKREARKARREITGVGFRLDDGLLVSFPLQTSQQEPG